MSKTLHEVLAEHGIDKPRLESALKSNDNWGKMVHAYEFLTVASAVLATWPEGTEPQNVPEGYVWVEGHWRKP